MSQKPPFEPKPSRPNKILKYVMIGVGLAAFRGEIWNVILWGFWLLRNLAGLPVQAPPLKPVLALAAMTVTIACFFLLALLLTAQGVLPSRTFKQQVDVFYHLLRHFFHIHGPAINVKEGEIIGNAEELKTARSGIAFVDQSSALVLEKQWAPAARQPALPANQMRGPASAEKSEQTPDAARRRPWLALLKPLSQSSGKKSPSLVRVEGPGIVFTRSGEKVRGAAHLRKQVRHADDVHAYTSDGIEIFANISVVFTLGQPPRVVQVVCEGEENPGNIRLAAIDPATKKIEAISDHLDLQDKSEIFQRSVRRKSTASASAPLFPGDAEREYPPFLVNNERIFAAIYSQARNMQESGLDDWTDLPVRAAVKVFRNMLARQTYDWLYEPPDSQKSPRLISEFKQSFAARLRGLGVLSYQYLRRRDGASPRPGDIVDKKNFHISPVQELRQAKELRSRGIKLIDAGFSDLKPVNPAVMQQRLQNWQARWQRETNMVKADLDLEMARVRNRARAQAQREMTFALAQIYKNTSNSQEALAARIFQSLVETAADPATRQLLPDETIKLLRSLGELLLPAEETQPRSPDDGQTGANGVFGR